MTKKINKISIYMLLIFMCATLFCGVTIGNITPKKAPEVHAYEEGSYATFTGNTGDGTVSATLQWWYKLDYNITTLTITNNYTVPENPVQSFDVLEEKDGSLMAYVTQNSQEKYDCVIYGNVETIYAPVDCTWMFVGYYSVSDGVPNWEKISTLEEINFETFNTSKTTIMTAMIRYLPNLTNLDLSGWSTSGVTNMDYLFEGCTALETLDISSFEINSSTSNTNMFSKCSNIKTIYAPKKCETSIRLPVTMIDQDTTDTYSHLTSASNEKVLLRQSVLSQALVGQFSQYNITELLVTNNFSNISGESIVIDVSSNNDQTINAYLVDNGNSTYKCVIYSEDTIYAPKNCNSLFAISSLQEIRLNDLDTQFVTDMSNMFSLPSYDLTLKGYCVLNGLQYYYTEGMSFIDLFVAFGGDAGGMSNKDIENAIEAELGFDIVESGSYDMTIEVLCSANESTPYTEGMTFKDYYQLGFGSEYDGTEAECKAFYEDALGLNLAYAKDEDSGNLAFVKVLDISNFVISEETNVTDMLFGLSALEILYAPTECNAEISLPVTMYKESTSTEYASLSSSTNSLTLLNTANTTNTDNGTTTPSTGFVDEQLIPMIAVAFMSIVLVAFVGNKKKEFNK